MAESFLDYECIKTLLHLVQQEMQLASWVQTWAKLLAFVNLPPFKPKNSAKNH